MSARPPPSFAPAAGHSGSALPAVPPPARTANANPDAPLLVSAGVRIKGNLSCDLRLQIDGFVEGDVAADSITIGPTGAVIGSLSARLVFVEGAHTGRIHADSVTIASSGTVDGDMVQNTLCILPGANFQGSSRQLNRTTESPPARPPRPPASD